MCGIGGVFSSDGTIDPAACEAAAQMLEHMRHRGPDDKGIFQDEHAVLAHSRLSIIDLSPAGRQPMRTGSKPAWLVFNGEIYNFRELRRELQSVGRSFESDTDSEVIIQGYGEWGLEPLLARLRGMFAFAIYDPTPENGSSPRLILARDRFGIKPLYYYQGQSQLVFASEVRAAMSSGLIPDESDPEAVIRFLQLGSIPSPYTTIKGLLALPAGHYLVADSRGSQLQRYWDLSAFIPTSPGTAGPSREEACERTRTALNEAVKLHLVSDVPLGVFLSGGTDSSSLVALASESLDRPLTTLSVVFDEPEFSEAPFARAVARKFATDHREARLAVSEFRDNLPAVFAAMDQPTVDGVNTYFISKAAKQAGLTVVLSGTGGDEVFLGYRHFRLAARFSTPAGLLRALPGGGRTAILSMAASAWKLMGSSSADRLDYLRRPDAQHLYMLFRGLFSRRQIASLLDVSRGHLDSMSPLPETANGNRASHLFGSICLLEFHNYLQNQLLKDTDFMSMAHSIETRVPFLDHKLAELVVGFPRSLKLGDRPNKPLLVGAMGDDLPSSVWNRRKMGFTLPFSRWLAQDADEMMAVSSESRLLDKNTVRRVWEDFKRGRAHWSRPWALFVIATFTSGIQSRRAA